MNRHLTRILFCLALAAVARIAHAADDRAEGALDAGEPRLEARLLVDPDRSGTASLRAGVVLTPDAGWHVYWKHAGDVGLPTRLAWRGGEAGVVRWPAPTAFHDDGLVSFGYEGSVLLASEIRMDPGVETLGVDVDAVVCRESCIPTKLSLERRVDASYRGEAEDAVRRLFALHEASVPHEAGRFGLRVFASLADGERSEQVRLAVRGCEERSSDAPCAQPAMPAEGPVLFPAAVGLRVLEASARRDGIDFLLEREAGADLAGVLALRGGDGFLHHVELAVPADAIAARIAPSRVVAMLALAVLGGLLLNAMPCVLPVLALKVFAVVELAGRRRREALEHGLAYTAGILASMLTLAAVVLALRHAGSEVGWGFQFQSPGFVAVLAALCLIFALNLFGVFEIGFVPGSLAGVGAGASGTRRSFFEGLLAVALATPCSAPFLGTAVGFAFASHGAFVIAIFLAIGLGLALPFLVISAVPPAAHWLPRPGAWMGELRSLLGFALLATVVWLAFLLGRSAGADAVAGLLALLLALSLAAHGLGRVGERRGLRGALAAAAVALVVGAPNWITPQAAPPPQPHAADAGAAWSRDAVERLRAEGRPVLVVFGADWCLTCQWNERRVLASEAVQRALARAGYAVLLADWTQRDEAIRSELLRFGKAGVPLTLVYRPGAAEPQVLPELLSVEGVLAALDVGEGDHAQGAREADAS